MLASRADGAIETACFAHTLGEFRKSLLAYKVPRCSGRELPLYRREAPAISRHLRAGRQVASSPLPMRHRQNMPRRALA